MDTQQPQRRRAVEARNKYGVRAAVVFALTIWFGYDGWFNANIKAKTFNKVGAALLGGYCLFCIVMATSAALAVKRQDQSPPPPEPPATPPAA
jgi:purine-cytosine permease-like protein